MPPHFDARRLAMAGLAATGWHAQLDGEEAPVLRANVLFNAVVVPPGRHRVSLSYRPPALGAGAAATVCGHCALASLGLSSLLQLRRARVL